MDIIAALRQEEAKFEKEVSAAQQQLDTVRAAMKLLGGMNGSGKATGSSSVEWQSAVEASSVGEIKAVVPSNALLLLENEAVKRD